MKITRRQLRDLIQKEAQTLQENKAKVPATWEDVRAKMRRLGGYLLAYGEPVEEARRTYFFPDGLELNAAKDAVEHLGFKVVGRANKGTKDWSALPDKFLAGTIVGIDKQ